ncbi:MAG: nucleotidyl transferase AbiEii/AbiGii toxin family protein [Mycoplasma sp.]
MKNMIITGASALYKHKLISYNPSSLYVEMIKGVHTNNYSSRYKISLQNSNTLNIGAIEYDEFLIYVPERLFIELNKFSLENTVKAEALKNLYKVMNPEIVKKYYDQLKRKRRNIDHEMIKNYLEKYYLNLREVIEENNLLDKDQLIREYIMSMVSNKSIPSLIIKGGCAVELYISFKRSTADIDAHISKQKIDDVITILENKENLIYFKIENKEILETTKNIYKLILIPKSTKKIKGIEKLGKIDLTLNTTYDDLEIATIINDFSVSKKELKTIKNAKVLVFTKEMLIAEKYWTLIKAPTSVTRTKDLLDLVQLSSETIDIKKLFDWICIKAFKQKNEYNDKESILQLIKREMNSDLIKIKNNVLDAWKMYEVSSQEQITYEECFEIYKSISIKLLELNNK